MHPLSRSIVGKRNKNRSGPMQIRVEKDVEPQLVKSATDNNRTLPKEANHILRQALRGAYKRTVGC